MDILDKTAFHRKVATRAFLAASRRPEAQVKAALAGGDIRPNHLFGVDDTIEVRFAYEAEIERGLL
jgi:hypothetical protein